MKSELFQTSAVIIPEPEVEEFTWNFMISPRSKIQKNIEAVTFGGFTFNGLQFKTGFLADTDHTWGMSLYSNQVNAFMALPRRDLHHRYSVHDSQLQLISKDEVKALHKLTFQRDENAAAPRMLWSTFWINDDRSWNDSIDKMRIIFRIGRESTGRCLYSMVSQRVAFQNKAILETAKNIDCKDFYLSEDLSDVVLVCKGQKFPAHKFLLSCRSSVFDRMFRVSMKEVAEGRVVIEDMEPQVLEEMLRFMYCGHISTLEEFCIDLFQAADKYDIEPLKILCENEMTNRVSPENAIEMYMTAELHDAKLLKEKAFEVIRLNKKQVFNDRNTFKMFSSQFPDIAFDLFSSFQ
ncbi:unnamed protein product [Orchesella dallaii]|uniref:BTB domain-containing protein n=1 Tax=Orchesella dallaii TaxID=48710 RepID=A0ABP1PU50_9HEXA